MALYLASTKNNKPYFVYLSSERAHISYVRQKSIALFHVGVYVAVGFFFDTAGENDRARAWQTLALALAAPMALAHQRRRAIAPLHKHKRQL
jgi:hypothetical protein